PLLMVYYELRDVDVVLYFFFFSSRRRHTRLVSDWSSDVCSSDLTPLGWIFLASMKARTALTTAVLKPLSCVPPELVGTPLAYERSEERRVGKEGRCCGVAGDLK